MYNIMYETSCQSRFDARYWMLGAGALDDPEGGYGEGGGRRVQDLVGIIMGLGEGRGGLEHVQGPKAPV